MSSEAYELTALAARYVFVALIAWIVWRACRGAWIDSRRAARLRRLSPMTGLCGEMIVVEGDGQARRGMRYPVIREGTIGSSRRADIRIRHGSVRRRHAYFQLTDAGLSVRSHAGARLSDGDGRTVRELTLADGDRLGVGRVRLLLVLSMPEGAAGCRRETETDADALFDVGEMPAARPTDARREGGTMGALRGENSAANAAQGAATRPGWGREPDARIPMAQAAAQGAGGPPREDAAAWARPADARREGGTMGALRGENSAANGAQGAATRPGWGREPDARIPMAQAAAQGAGRAPREDAAVWARPADARREGGTAWTRPVHVRREGGGIPESGAMEGACGPALDADDSRRAGAPRKTDRVWEDGSGADEYGADEALYGAPVRGGSAADEYGADEALYSAPVHGGSTAGGSGADEYGADEALYSAPVREDSGVDEYEADEALYGAPVRGGSTAGGSGADEYDADEALYGAPVRGDSGADGYGADEALYGAPVREDSGADEYEADEALYGAPVRGGSTAGGSGADEYDADEALYGEDIDEALYGGRRRRR